jgi:hypothetical protein
MPQAGSSGRWANCGSMTLSHGATNANFVSAKPLQLMTQLNTLKVKVSGTFGGGYTNMQPHSFEMPRNN